ncbi:MAG: hypothetical protein ACR2H1_00305 [Limisphaerales bacterium]
MSTALLRDTATNYVLEACDDYATQNWQTGSQSPTIVNNQNTVDFATSAPVKIFRLRQV